MTGTIVLNSTSSEVRQLLFDESGAFRSGVSIRVMYRFDDGNLGQNEWYFRPSAAAPTFNMVQVNGKTVPAYNMHKASNRGYLPQDLGNSSIRFSTDGILLNRTGFEMAVEFIQQYATGYFVVAYGCFIADPSLELTESLFRQALAQIPLTLYAGRTCGECPPRANEFPSQDNPNFTLEALQTADPLECGGYTDIE